MAYNTGNPVGSNDFRDLSDNAVNFDKYSVGTDPTYPNRLGVLKLSIEGMNQEFNNAQDGRTAAFAAFLEASGYYPLGDYGAGITFTTRTQYTVRDGVLYRVAATTTLPYTTTGNWAIEQTKFVAFDTEDLLKQDLQNNTDLTLGATLVARAVRQINSVAELRTVVGRDDMDQCLLVGYHAAWNGYGGGSVFWAAASTDVDDGFSTFAVDGVSVGRWKRLNIEQCNVCHAGAIPGAESSDAIQAVFNWVRAKGYGTVNLTDAGFFLINKPIRGCANSLITGKAIIRAQSPFGSVSFDVFSGGTTSVQTMLYYADAAPISPSGTAATIGNPTGSRRQNFKIDETVTFDCDDVAAYGVFLDNYQYGTLALRITDAVKWGIYCYFYNWTMSIPAKITGSAEGGLWLGPAANGINLDGFLFWGETKTPTAAGVLIDGDNNGLSLAGATIEKAKYGVWLRNGFGPIDITGCDMEQIESHPIFADGSGAPSRINGPVTANSNFFETTSETDALIKCVNATVIAKGNRMRNAAKIVDQSSSGWVRLEANEVAATVLSVGTGRIHNIRSSARALVDEHYSSVSSTMESVRTTTNYGYPYAVLPSSGFSYSHQVTSGTNRTMVGTSTWYVANFNLDVETFKAGLNIDYSLSTPTITPINDNVQDFGSASKRSKVLWAGTGTISTSDAREKTEVRTLSTSEISAAKALGKEIGAYKWLNSVSEKGDSARDHIGMTVQRAIQIMEEHSLDPFAYGFICFDEWEARQAQTDEDGRIIVPSVTEGNRYSFRYDELNLFIAAGFEARLSALET